MGIDRSQVRRMERHELGRPPSFGCFGWLTLPSNDAFVASKLENPIKAASTWGWIPRVRYDRDGRKIPAALRNHGRNGVDFSVHVVGMKTLLHIAASER